MYNIKTNQKAITLCDANDNLNHIEGNLDTSYLGGKRRSKKSGKAFLILVAMLLMGQATWAQGVIWTQVGDEQTLRGEIGSHEYIKLTADITLTNHINWPPYLKIPDNVNVTIDLNGHTLSRNLTASDTDGHVIEVFPGGTLTLVDNSTAQTGTLTGGWATNGGGVCNKGTFHFNGGTIINCKATNGGGVRNDGTMTMAGGVIDNCDAGNGGGIYNSDGQSLTITSGTISNCGSNAGGGGIVNQGTLTLNGTYNDPITITNNSCETNGAGLWNNGNLSMGGYVNIKNNTGDDVYLKTDKKITVTGFLGEAQSIGINMETLGVFTNQYQENNTHVDQFFPSGTFNTIGILDGEAKMVYAYWGADVNPSTHEMVYTKKSVPLDATVYNVCSDMFASGGGLSDSKWFVADGTGTTAQGLTCGDEDRHLILCDGASITINEGLYVNSKNSSNIASYLHIYSQSFDENMGCLISENTLEGKPGIGGKDFDAKTGYIYIHGGHITAKGGEKAAGIGGGFDGGLSYDCGYVRIYGGQVEATGGKYGAGIGSGRGNDTNDDGDIEIYGGTVVANGGDYGAGIGGGQDANGANVIIYGGNVHAYGKTDAAGIGSGEQQSRTKHGGKLEVYGGYVFADGTDLGCGIGGGQDANGANVTINGGIVEAWCGSGSRTAAIGSHLGDGHRGSLHIGDSLMVKAGSGPSSVSLFTAAERVPACFYRDFARIEPCTHTGATYSVTGTGEDGTHTLHCRYCTHTPSGTHTFDEHHVCTVCGVNASISTISVYMPVHDEVNNTYSYGSEPTYTEQLVTGSAFELPAASAEHLPTGVRFVGWRIGSPSELGLTDPQVGDNESDILPAGYSYTITSDIGLTPRYNTFHVFTTDGNWGDASNWCWDEVPDDTKEIVIAADATIPDGYIARAGNITVDLGGSITIKDGGQLFHNNVGVRATIEKEITGYANGGNGWYFIASPMQEELTPSEGNGFLTNVYDLYYYDEPTHIWRNHRPATGNADPGFNIKPQRGYLYANDQNTTLSMTGTLLKSNDYSFINNLSYTESAAPLSGWHLVGNLFACKASINKPCYTLNGDAINPMPHGNGDYKLAPGESVLVQLVPGTEDYNSVTVIPYRNQQTQQSNQGSMHITLSQTNVRDASTSSTTLDKAIISFNEDDQLGKFVINEDCAKLFITQDGKDYAIVSVGRDGVHTVSTEIPINFKANENGTYTLSINPEGVEMAYLHLIDNMTGADVDLLAATSTGSVASYTFNAKTTDYESRFRLVFVANSEDGSSTGSEAFAFISNGNIIVNGEGTLQVVDVMGRVIVCRDGVHTVSTAGMPAGVYVLRLINGDDVKTQKIVVR